MNRHSLSVAQLEDRTTPSDGKVTLVVAPASVCTPPQDPMDNPPPTQPGTPSDSGPGSNNSGPGNSNKGSSTGPTVQVSAKVVDTPAFTVAFTLPKE